MYRVTQGTFRTPRGQTPTLAYREDTNDWNTLNSCLTEDEYDLKALKLSGTALDIGAHIGGVTIALALDNPELHVVAVEAVPPNVELLTENVRRAGVEDRVTILHAAAGPGKTAKVRWAFKGNEVADHHAFVGNAVMPESDLTESSEITLEAVSLAKLVADYGPIEFAKVDCEGCEYKFLRGKALQSVACIRGEERHGPLLFPANFTVTYTQDNAPRGFEAVRRG
jgi:FkbM family methyltransferase